jgi:hypothetical protein
MMKKLSVVLFLLAICLVAGKPVLADVYHPPYPQELKKLCAIYAQRYGINPADRVACETIHRAEDTAIRRMFQLRRQTTDPCAAQDAVAIRTWASADPQRRMYLIRPTPIGPPATLAELDALIQTKVQTQAQGGTSCRQRLNLQ